MKFKTINKSSYNKKKAKMTVKELNKKFAFAGKDGICSTCQYLNICDKILPGYNKPGKCGGPFYKTFSNDKYYSNYR